jgi:hypothetical protein
MNGLRPMIHAKLNGTDALFIADSGAFYSSLTPVAAAKFKLRLAAAGWPKCTPRGALRGRRISPPRPRCNRALRSGRAITASAPERASPESAFALCPALL